MMTSYQTSLNDREHVIAGFLGDVERAFKYAFMEARAEQKLTRMQLADRLNISRSSLDQRLLGRKNMTARMLAEMAWAMGYEIEFKLVPRKAPAEIERDLAME